MEEEIPRFGVIITSAYIITYVSPIFSVAVKTSETRNWSMPWRHESCRVVATSVILHVNNEFVIRYVTYAY